MDWREVYKQERRRPAYVIENGGAIVKVAVLRTWWKPKLRDDSSRRTRAA